MRQSLRGQKTTQHTPIQRAAWRPHQAACRPMEKEKRIRANYSANKRNTVSRTNEVETEGSMKQLKSPRPMYRSTKMMSTHDGEALVLRRNKKVPPVCTLKKKRQNSNERINRGRLHRQSLERLEASIRRDLAYFMSKETRGRDTFFSRHEEQRLYRLEQKLRRYGCMRTMAVRTLVQPPDGCWPSPPLRPTSPITHKATPIIPIVRLSCGQGPTAGPRKRRCDREHYPASPMVFTHTDTLNKVPLEE